MGAWPAPADLSGQANHLAATIGADIIKQKQATNNGGYKAFQMPMQDGVELLQAIQDVYLSQDVTVA